MQMSFLRPISRAGKRSPVFRYPSPTSSPDMNYFFFSAVSAGIINHTRLLTKLASLLWRKGEAGEAPTGRGQQCQWQGGPGKVWYVRVLQDLE